MKIFKLRKFDRFATSENITDETLKAVVAQMDAGLINANLGSCVYKKRVARQGEGKSGGFRVILFYRQGERVFFAHGFAKADAENISADELEALKEQSKTFFDFSDDKLAQMLKDKKLFEIQ